ncbi:MAG: hypothetical protein NT020_11245 [Chloroflexales bacterium]|nr:hypothetical protein [Chloroflexales bacterium]
MKKPWYLVALIVVAYPYIAVGIKLIQEESLTTAGVYFVFVGVLVAGIVMALRKPATAATVVKPVWEESLNQR